MQKIIYFVFPGIVSLEDVQPVGVEKGLSQILLQGKPRHIQLEKRLVDSYFQNVLEKSFFEVVEELAGMAKMAVALVVEVLTHLRLEVVFEDLRALSSRPCIAFYWAVPLLGSLRRRHERHRVQLLLVLLFHHLAFARYIT